MTEQDQTRVCPSLHAKITIQSVYLMPVGGDWLLYAPLHGINALINASSARALKRSMITGAPPDHPGLSGWFDTLFSSPDFAPEPLAGNLKPEFLGIIPTRACNSRCKYCDFGAQDAAHKVMPLDMAVKVTDWYAELVGLQPNGVLKIHFFGGEPMMAPEVVCAVVHRARLIAPEYGLIPEFEISTNGQYPSLWAHFLGDYFDAVVLSLDGPEAVQDAHRPLKSGASSFASAIRTAEIIGASQADLLLRACVSRQNVDAMPEIARWFCEGLNPGKINFQAMQETVNARCQGLAKPDPYTFARRFIQARAIAQQYGVPLIYGSDITTPQWSSCPVGKDTVIVLPDGKMNSCYLNPERWRSKGIDLSLGQISRDGTVTVNPDSVGRIRTMVTAKPRCRYCFCRWSCAGGCHVDNTWPGSSDQFSDFCLQTRIVSACTLLEDLGLGERLGGLTEDMKQMRALAEQTSDRLLDWE